MEQMVLEIILDHSLKSHGVKGADILPLLQQEWGSTFRINPIILLRTSCYRPYTNHDILTNDNSNNSSNVNNKPIK